MASEHVTETSKDTWQTQVLDSELPVLVDFWAEWCGPCKAIAPVLEELGAEFSGKINITKVNVDESRELAQEFGIRSIPTLLLFKGGEVIEKMVGASTKAQFQAKLEEHV